MNTVAEKAFMQIVILNIKPFRLPPRELMCNAHDQKQYPLFPYSPLPPPPTPHAVQLIRCSPFLPRYTSISHLFPRLMKLAKSLLKISSPSLLDSQFRRSNQRKHDNFPRENSFQLSFSLRSRIGARDKHLQEGRGRGRGGRRRQFISEE